VIKNYNASGWAMDCALFLLASLTVFGFVGLRLCVVCCVLCVAYVCHVQCAIQCAMSDCRLQVAIAIVTVTATYTHKKKLNDGNDVACK